MTCFDTVTVRVIPIYFRSLRDSKPVGYDTAGSTTWKLAHAARWAQCFFQTGEPRTSNGVRLIMFATGEHPFGVTLGHVPSDGALILGAGGPDDFRGFGVVKHGCSFRIVRRG
ncbi:MAG: hypothetical protein E6R14_01930 [Thermomicrobiales bacterium]|nr:MAG: hypothetical protein E6R14_01930 [Thermomicrobiales bacterium]